MDGARNRGYGARSGYDVRTGCIRGCSAGRQGESGLSPFREVSLLADATGALLTAMTRNGVRRLVCVNALGVRDSRGHGGFVFDGCSCLCREKSNETIREMVS